MVLQAKPVVKWMPLINDGHISHRRHYVLRDIYNPLDWNIGSYHKGRKLENLSAVKILNGSLLDTRDSGISRNPLACLHRCTAACVPNGILNANVSGNTFGAGCMNKYLTNYYADVIISTMASHITIVSSVYSIVCSGADQRKHQSSASLAFVRGIHRWPVNSPHKVPVTRKMFPFEYVVMEHTATSWSCRYAVGIFSIFRYAPIVFILFMDLITIK